MTNTAVGMPGRAAKPSIATEAMIQALGWLVICSAISRPILASTPGVSLLETRVMIIPEVTEISSAGICAIRPSPMVSTVYSCTASPALMPCWTTPMAMPPIMLIATMIRLAMASPLTNFIAPSMAPNNWLSLPSSERRRRASWTLIRLARRSLSMDICLPGMASRVNRAPTSATRSEPLVITRKFTTVRIMKITMPTARLPPTTNWPKASTMCPASWFSRIRRVVEIDSARRNIVVISSTEGKVENARGRGRCIASMISRQEIQMLIAISTSTRPVGNGVIIMKTMASTTNAPTISERRMAARATWLSRLIR